jgi:hypothetical protein
MQYTLEAVKRVYLTTTIEANSLEEAQEIADQLMIDDFEELGSDYTQTFLAPTTTVFDITVKDTDQVCY